MIKYVDIDALFEKYMKERVMKNEEKLSYEEWENKIPELYEEFGRQSFAELDGKTPYSYYADATGAELVFALSEQIERGLSVSEYLCTAIVESDGAEKPLIALLDSGEEEKVMYALNLLGDKNSDDAVPKYVELAAFGAEEEHIRELAAELLNGKCELCKETLLRLYGDVDEAGKALFCDVLSRCAPDERVYDVLLAAFKTHPAQVTLFSSFLARYGDERALSALYEAIERPNTDFGEFRELKFAIETLGGEYENKRDFSEDKIYKKLKSENAARKKEILH
ncbi:MAG: hypothetical protein DBX59_08850 [Bacillota bacterium]|nr:MAG: hypothetical protein DBX59_08850 [Bacillota bacterium]